MKTATLDADEYFHLALHASSVSDPHACISYLEEVLQRQPGNARALYLRAVQHAELGLTQRALNGIKAAITIDPALDIARFHLGLLLLFDRENRTEAREYLHRLKNSADQTLRTYGEALVSVADNDIATAQARLALGLARAPNDQPLAALVQRLLDRLSDGATIAPPAAGGGHVDP